MSQTYTEYKAIAKNDLAKLLEKDLISKELYDAQISDIDMKELDPIIGKTKEIVETIVGRELTWAENSINISLIMAHMMNNDEEFGARLIKLGQDFLETGEAALLEKKKAYYTILNNVLEQCKK
jgi:hypothetical protein